jgi:hypothetical protein
MSESERVCPDNEVLFYRTGSKKPFAFLNKSNSHTRSAEGSEPRNVYAIKYDTPTARAV